MTDNNFPALVRCRTEKKALEAKVEALERKITNAVEAKRQYDEDGMSELWETAWDALRLAATQGGSR